jgi:hypothetical protein
MRWRHLVTCAWGWPGGLCIEQVTLPRSQSAVQAAAHWWRSVEVLAQDVGWRRVSVAHMSSQPCRTRPTVSSEKAQSEVVTREQPVLLLLL